MPGKTHYEILGVAKNATTDEIRKAYYAKARTLHTDKKSGDEDAFKEINNAQDILRDQEKRKKYDDTLEAEEPIHTAKSNYEPSSKPSYKPTSEPSRTPFDFGAFHQNRTAKFLQSRKEKRIQQQLEKRAQAEKIIMSIMQLIKQELIFSSLLLNNLEPQTVHDKFSQALINIITKPSKSPKQPDDEGPRFGP